MWETQVQSQGQENPLEKGIMTHSIILTWRIPWTKEPGGLHSMDSQRVRYDWVTNTLSLIQNYKVCVCVFIFGFVAMHCSIMSDSLQPNGLQHTRIPCPSPSPGVCSNSCRLSQWCHWTTSSSVIPFSSCLLSFPVIWVFANESALHIRWIKYWSFSISLFNEYSGLISFRIDWFNFLAGQRTLESLQHQSPKASIPPHTVFLWSNSHIHTWLLEKPVLTIGIFVSK